MSTRHDDPIDTDVSDRPVADVGTLARRLRAAADDLARLAGEVGEVGTAGAHEGSEAANRAHTRGLVRAFFDLVEGGEFDQLTTVVADDLVYVVPGRSRLSGRHLGAPALTKVFALLPRPGVADLASEVVEVVVDGDVAAALVVVTGMIDGRPVSFEVMLRFVVADGRIVSITEYSGDQYLADDLFAPEPDDAVAHAPAPG